MDKDQIYHPSFDGAIDDKIFLGLRDYSSPDFAVGYLDLKFLPLTLWWIICEDIDLWCSHAAKKDMKKFITILIEAFLSCESDKIVHIDICNADKANFFKRVAAHQIALKFLSNTIAHEQRVRVLLTAFFFLISIPYRSNFSTHDPCSFTYAAP